MAILNFKEIPPSNSGKGNQDTFELFARDFFSYLGYKVLEGPDRGADGGRDILLEETRVGVGGEIQLKWLVSCKHKAHSGGSVTPEDESDIRDRLEKFGCQGFIAFYSTLPSAGLSQKLKQSVLKAEVQVFDCAKIESKLLGSSSGIELTQRYFPASIDNWQTENPKPARIFSEEPELHCENCHKDLLTQDSHGIIVIWTVPRSDYEKEKERNEDIYWCCKGFCDDKLSASRRAKGLIDSWEDIPDIMIPTVYVKWIMTVMNELRSGVAYSDAAFDKLKCFLLQTYPFVARHLTTSEKERLKSLMMIPSYLEVWVIEPNTWLEWTSGTLGRPLAFSLSAGP